MREFGIDGRVEEEIATRTPCPIVVSSANYHYAVLHFPASEPTGGAKSQEVDFIVGKKFLITTRYEPINSLHSLHKAFEAEELLGTSASKHERAIA